MQTFAEPEAGTSFYYSSLFLPSDRRAALCDLHAFASGLSAAGRSESPDEARSILDGWREAVAAIFDGDAPPADPLAARLGEHVRRFSLPRGPFSDAIDAAEMDRGRDGYETWDDLRGYLRRAAAPVRLGVEIFEPRHPGSRQYAQELGEALRLTKLLRDAGADAARGAVYLPGEDLRRFGVPEADILARRPTPEFRELMAFECARARGLFFQADARLPGEDRMALFVGEILQRIHYRTLERIEGSGFDVLRTGIGVSRAGMALTAFSIWLKYKILGGS